MGHVAMTTHVTMTDQ